MRNRSCFALGAGIAVAMWAMAMALSQADAGSAPIGGNGSIFRSTELAGLDVFNRGNAKDKLGHLSNLLIDAHNGRVLYGILDTGHLGAMERLRAGGEYPIPQLATHAG
jgi:hypothetical protein